MDMLGINFSDFEPGYKNTTWSWLKESFQMKLQPFWKHSGQTSTMEKWQLLLFYLMKTVTVY